MHSNCTGYGGGNLNAFLANIKSYDCQPKDKSMFYRSQAALVPIHPPRGYRRLGW